MESIYYITQKRGWSVYPAFFRWVSLWSFEDSVVGETDTGYKKGREKGKEVARKRKQDREVEMRVWWQYQKMSSVIKF